MRSIFKFFLILCLAIASPCVFVGCGSGQLSEEEAMEQEGAADDDYDETDDEDGGGQAAEADETDG